jgi:hypothetical protein
VALDISFLKNLSPGFAECLSVDTRQRPLCRVPVCGHSAKTTLPSARSGALGKVIFLIFRKSLPSARSGALGKEVKQQPLLLLHSLSLAHFSLTATPERHCQHPAAPALLPATPQRRCPLPPPRRPRSPRHLASCPSPARLCRVSAG